MKAERIKGFTLVELLVVLAIVAMLIGLLMPALGQVRKYAGTVKQKAQIGSIEIALSLYKTDFGQVGTGTAVRATRDTEADRVVVKSGRIQHSFKSLQDIRQSALTFRKCQAAGGQGNTGEVIETK